MIRARGETPPRRRSIARHWRLALARAWFMKTAMVKHSPLDREDTARIAWARYRRLMRGMAIVSLVAVVVALGWLRYVMGDALTIHMIIATAAGVGLSVLLASALMGLVFLSSGSGHDEAIDDPLADDPEMNNDR